MRDQTIAEMNHRTNTLPKYKLYWFQRHNILYNFAGRTRLQARQKVPNKKTLAAHFKKPYWKPPS